MKLISEFTIEDFKEALRKLKIPINELGMLFPKTKQQDDLLKKQIKKYSDETSNISNR